MTTTNEAIAPDCRTQYSRDWQVNFSWLRGYNEAMYTWLSGMNLGRPETPKDIPVVFSTPERAFADVIRPRVEAQVDIPVITFTMTGTDFDTDRFKLPSLQWSKFKVGDKWQLHGPPMPWNISYNITVWTRFQKDQDIINYFLLSRFTPKSYLHVNGKVSQMSLRGHTDSSNLEPGQDADRIIRHDYQFEVNAWMSMPYKEVGQISDVFVVIDNKESGDINSDDYINATDDVYVVEGDFAQDKTDRNAKVIVEEEDK